MLICELLNFGLEWLTLLAPGAMADIACPNFELEWLTLLEAVAAETAAFERSNGS